MEWLKPGKPVEGATNLSSLWCPQDKKQNKTKKPWETRSVSLRKEVSSSHRATSRYLLLYLLWKPRASVARTRLRPFQRTIPLQLAIDKYQLVQTIRKY